MSERDVLVVGAGPTGLTMAVEFKRLGVPFRLIDKSQHQAEHSQALVVQARTLEQFERYGIAAAAVQKGRPLKHAALISEGKTIVSVSLDQIPGRYPFVLFLPQSETESLLIDHLKSLGGTVERGTEMMGLSQKDDGVSVQLRGSDGNVETTIARWVVGCDGAHSAVREALQIPFSGAPVSLSFLLGDLELEGKDLPSDELRVYLHHGDVVFIGRLSEKVFRVIVALHSEQDKAEIQPQLTLEDFQEAIDRAGIPVRAVSATWMTPFRVNDRRAEHMRQGNIFLTGDASHIHSPVGGQGMNTGIQDAANLAWKIAAVRKGANPKLLETYEEERGAVSEHLLRNTSFGLKASTIANRLLETIRDAVATVVTRIPFVQEQIVGFVSETAINYRQSSIAVDAGGDGSLRAGDRMPNPDLISEGRAMRLLDSLKSARHLVVGLDVADEAQIRHQLPGADVLFLKAQKLDSGREEITELMGRDGAFVVIRPDGYVGFRSRAADLGQLQQYAAEVGLNAEVERDGSERLA